MDEAISEYNSDRSEDFDSEFGDDSSSSQLNLPFFVPEKQRVNIRCKNLVFPCSFSVEPVAMDPKFGHYRSKYKKMTGKDLFGKDSTVTEWKWFLDRSKLRQNKYDQPIESRLLFLKKTLDWTKPRLIYKIDRATKKSSFRRASPEEEEGFLLVSEAYFIYHDFCRPEYSSHYLFQSRPGPKEIQVAEEDDRPKDIYIGKELVFDSFDLCSVVMEFSRLCESYVSIWNNEIVKLDIVFWKNGFTVQNMPLIPYVEPIDVEKLIAEVSQSRWFKSSVFGIIAPTKEKLNQVSFLDLRVFKKTEEECARKPILLEDYFRSKRRRPSKESLETSLSIVKKLEDSEEGPNEVSKVWKRILEEIGLYFSQEYISDTFSSSEDYAREFQEKNGKTIRALLRLMYIHMRTWSSKLFCDFVRSGVQAATELL